MKLLSKDELRRISWRTFTIGIWLAGLMPVVLCLGAGQLAGGHGEGTIWLVGLGMGVPAIGLLLFSTILGITAWATTREATLWIIPGAMTGIGLLAAAWYLIWHV